MFIENNLEDQQLPIQDERLQAIAREILSEHMDPLPDCTLTFVTPDEIQKLNKTYRNVDEVTDVLSFSSGGETDPETGNAYLGDIIICLERAEEQAERSGHPLENEVQLLEIHGLLHLLGFDHDSDENRQKMWDAQNAYLDHFEIRLKRRPGEDFDF